MKRMEDIIKQSLCCKVLTSFGSGGCGCISSGQGYNTDSLGQVFVKRNEKSGARQMFDGEYAGLEAIYKTHEVRVPKPIKVLDDPSGGAVIVMEYIDMNSLGPFSSTLGEQLARLHLHNEEVGKWERDGAQSINKKSSDDDVRYIDKFGFLITTCTGYIPQDNTWSDEWQIFYCRKLETQINNMLLKRYGDWELGELWSGLQRKISKFFTGVDIKPALLHGDLWGGNVASTDSEPVIFDPATFYGHSEYDLAITGMFGGFDRDFYSSYHKLIPKADGFNVRSTLYELFHYLNHWNHFGGGYKGTSMSHMKRLLKS